MKAFVVGTCAVTDQPSDQCVVTTWYGAKEQGFDRKEAPEGPGGWGTYGIGGMKRIVSDVMDFKVLVSKEAILQRQNQQKLITASFIFIISAAVFLLLRNAGVQALSVFLIVPALYVLVVFGVMRLRGDRPRYTTLDELDPLDSAAQKRIAFKLSKRIAEKQASMTGRSIVLSSSRYKEVVEEDLWIIGRENPV